MHGFPSIWFALLGAALLAPGASFAQDSKLPDGPGKDTFVRVCSTCHGAQIVTGRGNTEDGWTQVVLNMIQRGASGSEDDFAQIVQYLTKNFPPQSDSAKTATAQININKATAGELETSLDLTAKESQSLVAYRQQNGNFKTADDLRKVPDLDFKKIEAKRDRITF